jgi:hypothetical protein
VQSQHLSHTHLYTDYVPHEMEEPLEVVCATDVAYGGGLEGFVADLMGLCGSAVYWASLGLGEDVALRWSSPNDVGNMFSSSIAYGLAQKNGDRSA